MIPGRTLTSPNPLVIPLPNEGTKNVVTHRGGGWVSRVGVWTLSSLKKRDRDQEG